MPKSVTGGKSGTCFENTVMSSSKDADEQTSAARPLSLGVQVANSHFSKTSASRGNSGCLDSKATNNKNKQTVRKKKPN